MSRRPGSPGLSRGGPRQPRGWFLLNSGVGDVALLGPDPPVGRWTCQRHCVCVLPSAQIFASLVQKVLCCQEKKVLSLLGPGKCFLTSVKET